jgi:hypothetical protein
MSDDVFKRAGEQLRRQVTRHLAARDQAVATFDDLHRFCKDAITSFYGDSQEDVLVERFAPSQLMIRFGIRPGKSQTILEGPMAIVFASNDGRLLWAAANDWVEYGMKKPSLRTAALEDGDCKAAITPKLVAFLTDGETAYQRAIT